MLVELLERAKQKYTKAELKFYETFGIEQDSSECAYFTGRYGDYPELTEERVFRLFLAFNAIPVVCIKQSSYAEFKEELLYTMCNYVDAKPKGVALYDEVRRILNVKNRPNQ